MLFLQYYWETIKVDMSRLFNTADENKQAARDASVKVFAIRENVRDLFIKTYCEYCRNLFTLNFIVWRVMKVKILDLNLTFDWNSHYQRVHEKLTQNE